MQRPAERGVVAELRVANDRRDREPCRAHLAQQGQRQAPLRLESHGGRNLRPRALARREPFLGQIQGRAQEPRPGPSPQGDGDGRLTIRDLAARAAVLPRDPDRSGALFREAGPIENQDPRALWHHRAQSLPHGLGVPRRVRDEMLKGLIGARIAQARPHRFHRLAATVAQQAGHIATQRPALTLAIEARFEELQPDQQPTQPRRGGVIQHRAVRYRTSRKSTMPSKVITREFQREFVNLTK